MIPTRRLLATLTSVAALATTTMAAEWQDLWPAAAPGAPQPPAGSETNSNGSRLSNIEKPQFQVYLPEKTKPTAAVVVLPGGGYGILASDHEGTQIAAWLNERGIAAILVKYRVSQNPAFGYQFPVPFLDARRAIRTTRARAAEWGIDPTRVGIMGFSAGGHLASLCTTRFADTFEQEKGDEIDKQNCRPDFSILVYPVISMDGAIGHQGSRKNLLGSDPDPALVERCSTERAVTKDTPPVFLLTTSDDVVDCRNSLNFAAACKEAGVPVSLHLFESGGHGYGLHGKGDLATWPDLLDHWLKRTSSKGKP